MKARNPSVFVISNTCFNENDEFDPEAQRLHFRRFVAAGIGAFVGGGGSGEGFKLTPTEYAQLMQIAKEELKGKIGFRVMGFEPRSAEVMIGIYKTCKAYDPDAMQIYSLHAAVHPSMKMLEGYFHDVLAEVKIPVVLSSHFTEGYMIPIDMIDRLLKQYKNIIGFNISTNDFNYIAEAKQTIGDRAEIHTGGPAHTLSTLAIGGQGNLDGGEGNLAPRTCQSVINYYKAGEMDKCLEAHKRQLQLFRHGGGKTGLRVLGLPGSYPRRPRPPVTPEQEKEILMWMERLKVREFEGIK